MTEVFEWKLKQAVGKVAVVPLNSAMEFPVWHPALRRLAAGYNMTGALMYSVPEASYEEVRSSMLREADALEAEDEPEGEGDELSEEDESKLLKIREVALPTKPKPRSTKDLALMKTMGVSATMDDFFASTSGFINVRTGVAETEKESFYRQEIWIWMEQSLSRGQFQWLVGSIPIMFDITSLYKQVAALANKVTWISLALKFKKIFTLRAPSNDIFMYQRANQTGQNSKRSFGREFPYSSCYGAISPTGSGMGTPYLSKNGA